MRRSGKAVRLLAASHVLPPQRRLHVLQPALPQPCAGSSIPTPAVPPEPHCGVRSLCAGNLPPCCSDTADGAPAAGPAARFSRVAHPDQRVAALPGEETAGRGGHTSGVIILSSRAFCLLVNNPNKMLGSNSICHASHTRIIQPEIESVQPPLEAVP